MSYQATERLQGSWLAKAMGVCGHDKSCCVLSGKAAGILLLSFYPMKGNRGPQDPSGEWLMQINYFLQFSLQPSSVIVLHWVVLNHTLELSQSCFQSSLRAVVIKMLFLWGNEGWDLLRPHPQEKSLPFSYRSYQAAVEKDLKGRKRFKRYMECRKNDTTLLLFATMIV